MFHFLEAVVVGFFMGRSRYRRHLFLVLGTIAALATYSCSSWLDGVEQQHKPGTIENAVRLAKHEMPRPFVAIGLCKTSTPPYFTAVDLTAKPNVYMQFDLRQDEKGAWSPAKPFKRTDSAPCPRA